MKLTMNIKTGTPRLLRHTLPDGLQRHGGRVPRRDGQADAHHDARGLHAVLGVRGGHADAERREPAALLVRERQRPRYRVIVYLYIPHLLGLPEWWWWCLWNWLNQKEGKEGNR